MQPAGIWVRHGFGMGVWTLRIGMLTTAKGTGTVFQDQPRDEIQRHSQLCIPAGAIHTRRMRTQFAFLRSPPGVCCHATATATATGSAQGISHFACHPFFPFDE